MAEAAVEQPSSRFFCHQCSGSSMALKVARAARVYVISKTLSKRQMELISRFLFSGEIRPVLPGFTCPQCDSGFIEEISPAFEEERRDSSTSEPSTEQNPITDALFDIWGRHFLTRFARRYSAWRGVRFTDNHVDTVLMPSHYHGSFFPLPPIF